jgi:hypothetical protein
MRTALVPVGLNLIAAAAIAAAVVYGLGALTGNEPLTPTLMMFAAPDVAVWIYAIIAFFAVRAVVRAVCVAIAATPPHRRLTRSGRRAGQRSDWAFGDKGS